MTEVVLTREDLDFIALACSLEKVPGDQNWVDKAGGLPEYICQVAKALVRGGKSVSVAISIAVSRCKVWAAGGGGVNPDTRAKAAAAIAQWEAKKAKSGKKTKLTSELEEADMILNLTSFNLDAVSSAYQNYYNAKRVAWSKSHSINSYLEDYTNPYPYRYVKEVWSNYLIVKGDGGRDASLYKIPFTADKNGSFTFEDEVAVKQAYVVIKDTAELSAGMSDAELVKLSVVPCSTKEQGSLSDMVALSNRLSGKSLTEKFEDLGLKL